MTGRGKGPENVEVGMARSGKADSKPQYPELSEEAKLILSEIRALPDEDYRNLMVAAFDGRRPPEIQKSILKRMSRRGKIHAERAQFTGVAGSSNEPAWPDNCPPTKSRSAWKSPFIYAGDYIPNDAELFFDVEKKTLKKQNSSGVHQVVASSVAVVDRRKELLVWSFVRHPEKDVCQTFPGLTGITKEKLTIGQSPDVVSHFVDLAFQGNLIVGFDMENDLKALNVRASNTMDLSDYFVDAQNQKYSLSDLVKHFFGKEDVQCGIHSAIQDARCTRDLYYKMRELQREYPDFRSYPEVIKRTKKSFTFNQSDICRCIKGKDKKKKKPKNQWFVSKDDDEEDNQNEEFPGAYRPG